MSGHSKFSNIKHRKAAQDAKRGKAFTKIGKELTIAAKEGGSDINFNSKLRVAFDKAKAANMTKDKIEYAIKRGTGEIEGQDYIEIRYEGYGPCGVAFIVDAVTDNKNRTASNVRAAFTKYSGNLGETGAVSWMFEKKGQFEIEKGNLSEDDVFEIAIEAGAEDVQAHDEIFEILCEPNDFDEVKAVLEKSILIILKSEVTFIPKNLVDITTAEDAKKVLTLFDKLDEDDDVQEVYANFEIPDDILEQLA